MGAGVWVGKWVGCRGVWVWMGVGGSAWGVSDMEGHVLMDREGFYKPPQGYSRYRNVSKCNGT